MTKKINNMKVGRWYKIKDYRVGITHEDVGYMLNMRMPSIWGDIKIDVESFDTIDSAKQTLYKIMKGLKTPCNSKV